MEHTVKTRPDEDILEEIREFVRGYDPLKRDRAHFECSSVNGHVVLQGHTRTTKSRRVLVDNVPDLAGVISVDASQLYDDESLRFDIGKVLPRGTFVRVNYGTVVITGTLPKGVEAQAVVEAVKAVPGVRPQVVTEFI
jgi:osmotically-inducible protein OsmY